MNHQMHWLENKQLRWFEACDQAEKAGTAYCLVTIIADVGSVPRSTGTKMVVTSHAQFDTIGGGNLEQQAINHVREQLSSNNEVAPVQIEKYSLAADLAQCCGGGVQVMFEFFNLAVQRIAIIGAGHIAQELVPMLAKLNCHVSLFDTRQEWLDRCESQAVTKVCYSSPYEVVNSLAPGTWLFIMSHDHSLDFDFTKHALENSALPFVGLIGSQGKKQRFKFRLKEQLNDIHVMNKLHCPIGHRDIGGKKPIEVAISVAAQVIIMLDSKHKPITRNQTAKNWQQANTLSVENKHS